MNKLNTHKIILTTKDSNEELISQLEELSRILSINDIQKKLFEENINRDEARILYLYLKLFFIDCKKEKKITLTKLGNKYEIYRAISKEAQRLKESTGKIFVPIHTKTTYEIVSRLLQQPFVKQCSIYEATQHYGDMGIDKRESKGKKKILIPEPLIKIEPYGRKPYLLTTELLFFPLLEVICMKDYKILHTMKLDPNNTKQQVNEWIKEQNPDIEGLKFKIYETLKFLNISLEPKTEKSIGGMKNDK